MVPLSILSTRYDNREFINFPFCSSTPDPEHVRGGTGFRRRPPEAAVWGGGPTAAQRYLAVGLRDPDAGPGGEEPAERPCPAAQLGAVPAGGAELQGGEPAGGRRAETSSRTQYNSHHICECERPHRAAAGAGNRMHRLQEEQRYAETQTPLSK